MTNDPSECIVCATDLSTMSRCALDTAIELASRNGGSRLHVLHVREGTERIETVEQLVAREEERERELRREVDEEVAHVSAARGSVPSIEIVAEVRYGKAFREILRYAVEVQAELIVVGTHGRTGLGHVLGSVAERVARHAPCNVVVAKSAEVRARLAEILARGSP